MDTVSEKLVVTASDGGKFNCIVEKPGKNATAAVIIVQEIFGVTKWLKSAAEWYASNGYLAIVPDLFWRLEPGLNLNDRDENDLKKAFKYYGEFNKEKGIDDLKQVLKEVRAMKVGDGKVGISGYCLGGLMTYLMAARSDVDASVAYYGGGIDEFLGEANHIKKPIMMHFAEDDGHITRDKQDKIKNALGANPLVTIHTYAHTDHAFCRVGGQNYNMQAAELANGRTLEFFKKNLA
ncbi:MAG TPA: dienelactone hydrolase family protein [Drouetiella sp.]